MAVKLSKSHLPDLLSWLQLYLPHSFKVYGELRCHLRGDFPDLNFFVDRWPDPQAVVVVTDPAGEELACKDFYKEMVGGIYGVNDEVVRNLLRDPAVVDWNRRSVFCDVSDRLRPVMQKTADEMGKSTEFIRAFLLKVTPQDLKPLPVPEGMKTRLISSTDIGIVASNWKTWKNFIKGSESYIQELINRLPSLYLETENGRHVGHMMGQSFGTMGMLFVQPEFRRKGYGKFIVSQLAQKYFDRKEDAYVCVEDSNLTSLALHQSLGFRVVPEMKVVWMICSPKNA